MRKLREEKAAATANVLDKFSELHFQDLEDFMFETSDEDVTAIQISQEKGNDRK